MPIAALILAAGSSSRMGRPKALLTYRGRTFIETIVEKIREAAIDCIVVAISPTDHNIINYLDLNIVSTVTNEEDSSVGPIGSIRAGVLEIINRPVEAMLVWPVDQPHVMLETIKSLYMKFLDNHPEILVPVFGGRRGHPVVFHRSVFGELISVPNDQGARAVVRSVPARVQELAVQDSAIVEDIDTPDDYNRFISSTESLL